MQDVAYFNANDEMIVTKVDMRKVGSNAPEGLVRVNLGEPEAKF